MSYDADRIARLIIELIPALNYDREAAAREVFKMIPVEEAILPIELTLDEADIELIARYCNYFDKYAGHENYNIFSWRGIIRKTSLMRQENGKEPVNGLNWSPYALIIAGAGVGLIAWMVIKRL